MIFVLTSPTTFPLSNTLTLLISNAWQRVHTQYLAFVIPPQYVLSCEGVLGWGWESGCCQIEGMYNSIGIQKFISNDFIITAAEWMCLNY